MRRNLAIATITMMIAASPIFAVGTVNQSLAQIAGSTSYVYTENWTADAANGSVPATVMAGVSPIQGFRIISVEIAPGSPAPTNNYTVTVTDFSGADLLAGAGANQSNTTAGVLPSLSNSPPIYGSLTVNVTGNSVNSAQGKILVYFAPISQIVGNTSGGPSLTGNNLFSGTNTFSGTNSFTGTTTLTAAKQINNKLWASQFAGVDCGAKADAAFAQAGGPYEVEIDQICAPAGNLGSTQIVVPAGNGLAFDQPGSYTTSNAQTQAIFLNANTYLDCRARGSVTITENQANTHLVTVLSSTEVRNCDLHGTGTAGTASAINSGSASNVYIHDNILESMGANGINTGTGPTEWRVENNLIRNNLGEGFLCGPNCQQSYIAYNHFTGNASNGFDLNGGTNRVISNEADHNGGAGASGLDKDGMISFASGATSNSINNIWIGNYSHDNNSHGFRWQSGTGGTTQGNIHIGNRASGNGTGTTPCGTGFVLRNDGTNGIVTNNTFIGNTSTGNLGSGAGCADGFALISSGGAGAFNTTQIIGGEMQSNANWGIEITNSNSVDTDIRDTVLTTNTTGAFSDSGVRSRIRGIKNQTTDSEDPVNTSIFAVAGPAGVAKQLRIYGFNNTDDQTTFHNILSDSGSNSVLDIQPIGGAIFKFQGSGGGMLLPGTTNQLIFNTANNTNISVPNPAAGRTYTIGDFGANGNIPIIQAGDTLFGTYRVTADQTITAGASLTNIPGLTWTFPANTALNVKFSCDLLYSQATAAASDSFGFQDVTVAPTNAESYARADTSATAFTAGNSAAAGVTTAVTVVTYTPSAATTVFGAHIDGLIEQPSNASTSAFNIMAQFTTNNGTIKRGSSCQVF